jgi:hypothetical protein
VGDRRANNIGKKHLRRRLLPLDKALDQMLQTNAARIGGLDRQAFSTGFTVSTNTDRPKSYHAIFY